MTEPVDHAQILAAVARVEERVIGVKETLDREAEETGRRLGEHHGRLDSLERTRDRQKGAAILGTFLVSIGAAIGSLFTWGQ